MPPSDNFVQEKLGQSCSNLPLPSSPDNFRSKKLRKGQNAGGLCCSVGKPRWVFSKACISRWYCVCYCTLKLSISYVVFSNLSSMHRNLIPITVSCVFKDCPPKSLWLASRQKVCIMNWYAADNGDGQVTVMDNLSNWFSCPSFSIGQQQGTG